MEGLTLSLMEGLTLSLSNCEFEVGRLAATISTLKENSTVTK
jgi:hypothetical protein